MSHQKWGITVYGISAIHTPIDENRLAVYLCRHMDIIEEFGDEELSAAVNGGANPCQIYDMLEEYNNETGYGLYAFIADLIAKTSGIELIECVSSSDNEYVGLSIWEIAPWDKHWVDRTEYFDLTQDVLNEAIMSVVGEIAKNPNDVNIDVWTDSCCS